MMHVETVGQLMPLTALMCTTGAAAADSQVATGRIPNATVAAINAIKAMRLWNQDMGTSTLRLQPPMSRSLR
jgi:uncharacterized protein YggE